MEFVIMAAIIAAIVEVIKKTNKIPKDYLPFLAMILGVIIVFISGSAVGQEILIGITAGLSAVGLYETGKNVKKPVEPLLKTVWTNIWMKK